jgi:asparagine synthetase B (glutamine-hydrolysing)
MPIDLTNCKSLDWQPLFIDGSATALVSGTIYSNDAFTELRNCVIPKFGSLQALAEFLHDNFSGDGLIVLRSPILDILIRPPFSEIQVYYLEDHGSLIVFGTIEEYMVFRRKNSMTMSVDYRSIASFLLNEIEPIPGTGIDGVAELLSGSVLHYGSTALSEIRVHRLVNSLQPDYDKPVAELASDVRALTLAAVANKLPKGRGGIGIAASGGFDSSVIASLIHNELRNEQSVDLIHLHFPKTKKGDEVVFFHSLSEATKQNELYVDMDILRETILSTLYISPSFRPSKMFPTANAVHLTQKLSEERGNRVILSGDGGDQLFFDYQSSDVIFPLWKEEKTFFSGIAEVMNFLVLQDETLWNAIRTKSPAKTRDLVKSRLRGLMNNRIGMVPRDLETNVRSRYGSDITEVLSNLDTTRLYQFLALRVVELNTIVFKDVNQIERRPFLFWPLIKQMIACCRKHHFADGQMRGLGRKAFFTDLPASIQTRYSKGSSPVLVDYVDRKILLEKVMDGRLMKNGVLDKKTINPAAIDTDRDVKHMLWKAAYCEDWMDKLLA